MLELAAIFTTGGLLLFYKAFCTLKFDIIDKLIKKILIQDKSGEDSYFEDPYRIKWSFANPHNLVIVLVYREMFQVNYIQELIEIVKNSYV
jgi:signal recognition particle receptor subunit alpha